MWSCERTRADSPRVRVEDVDIRFQTGLEQDGVNTQGVEIVHIDTKWHARLGSLALSGELGGNIDFNDIGFSVSGGLVETAENGFITKRLGITETWEFSVDPD